MDAVKSAMGVKPKLSLPVKDKRIEDILLWRDPKKTGIALAIVTGVYGLIHQISLNPVVMLANMAQVAVIACFLWNLLSGALKQPGVPVPKVVHEGISEADAKDTAARFTVYANRVLAMVERVITGKDFVLTLQVSGALFVVARIASVVSPLTLAYLGVLSLFALPKLYELKKDEIDLHVTRTRDTYHNVYSKHVDPLMKKIPRASTATSKSNVASPPAPAKVADTADSLKSEVQSMMDSGAAKKYF